MALDLGTGQARVFDDHGQTRRGRNQAPRRSDDAQIEQLERLIEDALGITRESTNGKDDGRSLPTPTLT